MMERYIIPAMARAPPTDTSVKIIDELNSELRNVLNGKSRFDKDLEFRLRPSKQWKDRRYPFKS